jgi:dolichyl-phosphate beta-glucosyltransferase
MANLQKGVLQKVKAFLNKKKYKYEVIIVDDGSKDGSVNYIKSFLKEAPEFHLIQNSHLGKAGAVTAGMLKATGEYALFTDMDQATPIEEVDKLLPYFGQGYDIVIGSRYAERKGSPWSRRLMSWGWMKIRNAFINTHGISDTNCGFKMFRHEVSGELFALMNKFHNGFKSVEGSSVTAGFDVELLYLAQKIGYKIKEVPVTWLYVETRRVSLLNDSLDGIYDLVRIKKNDMSGKYKGL